MVKNTTGGSKAKGQARKSTSIPTTNRLRISEDDCELYAQVTALLGNGMCHVICIDSKSRLCHIRGKFRGRGKRDNFIGRGTWLLVGLRDWESGESKESKGKLQNCDLLEVYKDLDKDRLKNSVHVDWSVFVDNDKKNSNLEKVQDIFEFIDKGTEEYDLIIKEQTVKQEFNCVMDQEDMKEKEEEIDVNDI
jgi:translation initiation factor 1A